MTPENTASTVAQAGESTPENAALPANYALLTRSSPPLGAALTPISTQEDRRNC
jgi:hypothetical protein